MPDTAVTLTLDRERSLDVRPHLIELERVTGTGVGRLVARVVAGEFRAADLAETVRLGLMGGGVSPAEAASLAKTYVSERPLTEGHGLALAILLAAWNGTKAPVIESVPEDAEAGDIIVTTGNRVVRFNNDGSETVLRGAP